MNYRQEELGVGGGVGGVGWGGVISIVVLTTTRLL